MNCLEWPYREMEWKDCGAQTKVKCFRDEWVTFFQFIENVFYIKKFKFFLNNIVRMTEDMSSNFL